VVRIAINAATPNTTTDTTAEPRTMKRWSDFDWPTGDGVGDGPRPAGNGRGVRGTA